MLNSSSLKPIRQPKTLREMAYKAIKDAILTGDMQQEETFSEPYLANLLNISRTPIREALQDLTIEGFVKAVPKKGYRIRSFQLAEIDNLYDYRMAIELAKIKDVARDISIQQLAELESIIQLDGQASDSQDMKAFVKNNRSFHRYLISMTHNSYFIEAMERVLVFIEWAALKVPKREDRIPMAHKEHQRIFLALKSKDPDETFSALEDHLLISKEMVLKSIETNPGLAGDPLT